MLINNNKDRLIFLDGMRGIAIMLVVIFHAYARWPDLYPYTNQYSDFILFKYGWIGVELFFLISGFVILMTLEKCNGVADFMLRRWFRLFPAMLVCSLFIFLTAGFFHERPAGSPILEHMLPGVLFITPEWFVQVFKQPWTDIEGSFWSLYVEVKFYLIFGVFYYLLGVRLAIASLILLFSIYCATTYAEHYLPYLDIFRMVCYYTDAKFFGWFASGAIFYEFYKTGNLVFLILASFVGAVSAILFQGLYPGVWFVGVSVVIFFAGSLFIKPLQSMLSCGFLLFVGFISYPFYLLHENIMVSLIIKIGDTFPFLNGIISSFLSILLVLIIGFIFANYLEPMTKKIVKPVYQVARRSLVF